MQASIFDPPVESGRRGTGRVRLVAALSLFALIFTACTGGGDGSEAPGESEPATSQGPGGSGGATGAFQPPSAVSYTHLTLPTTPYV